MGRTISIFTPATVERILKMRRAGAGAAEIAVAIGSKSANSVNVTIRKLRKRARARSNLAPRSDFHDLASLPPRPDVEPVHSATSDFGVVRCGTVIKDSGVWHAMDARWNHLGWFAAHHDALHAVREHHDQQPQPEIAA
jgi:hypothetical protein